MSIKKTIDIIDIIRLGGVLPFFNEKEFAEVFVKEKIMGGKSFVYIGYIGNFIIECSQNYEQIYKSSDNKKASIEFTDSYKIMELNLLELLKIKQILPSFQIETFNDIQQTNIVFDTKSKLIYDDSQKIPVLLENFINKSFRCKGNLF